jgi:hypothetical protein
LAQDRPSPARITEVTLGFYRDTLDWLSQHHADAAARTDHDLAANERENAVWKLSGQAIAYAYALVELLERGYTGQTWALMRAIHEVDRLLLAALNDEEERIVRRWLENKEVKQSEARKSEQRHARRINEQLTEAGEEPLGVDPGELSREIYSGLSAAAHHRRSIVDEGIDHKNRTMIYGPDPRDRERLDFTAFAGQLIHEVLIAVGGALSYLGGPAFRPQQLQPMLDQFEEALKALDAYELLKRLGLYD